MISNRPYLIRAIYDWIVDNNWTPHMQVDANYPGVEVPQEHVQDGMIVLNVSPTAVGFLSMENQMVSFRARFSGVERSLRFPPEAILAVFARENGHGMPFPAEPYPEEFSEAAERDAAQSPNASKPKLETVAEGAKKPPAGKNSGAKPATKTKKPTLTVVK